eukprot:TRINITY_DN1792_c0_g1_i4.p1 TRINITY_DN1792_c0_g1~~TRINITY_DN1792_c0_g1_i4.p1  ORF type:complete len:409 (-),score=92.51 TRINITY_DN1792_c0_g1_i4:360-1586(-)
MSESSLPLSPMMQKFDGPMRERRMTFGSFSGSPQQIERLRGGAASTVDRGNRSGSASLIVTNAVDDESLDGSMSDTRSRAESIFAGPKTSEYGITSQVGMNVKKENQDTFFYIENFGGSPDSALFGVFDGHGKGGGDAARVAKELVYKHLAEVYMKKGTREEEIHEAFVQTQHEMQTGDTYRLCGTTATICLVSGLHMYIANVGDSKAVLGRECVPCFQKGGPNGSHMRAFDVTHDHKLTNTVERQRVIRSGGLIKRHPKVAHDCERIWKEGQNYPGLVVTRTLGDTVGHQLGVSCEPEIQRKILEKRDKVIVIASDGVWDVITPQGSIDLVVKHENPAVATEALVDTCLANWKAKYADGDNITAIVVFLGAIKKYNQNYHHHPMASMVSLRIDCKRQTKEKIILLDL